MNPPPTSWTQLTAPVPWSPTTPGEVLIGRLLKPETRTRHADHKVFTSWSVRLADGTSRYINHVQLVAILESEGLQPGTWVRAIYTGQRLGNQGRTYGTFKLYVATDSPALAPPTFGDEDAPLPVPPPPGRDVPWELLAPEMVCYDHPEEDGPPAERAPLAAQPVRVPGARLPPPRELRSLKRYLAEVESMTDGALAPQVWLDHGPHGATDAVQRKARDYLVDVLRVRFKRPQGRDELTRGLIQERALRRPSRSPIIPTDPQPCPALAEVREDDHLPRAVMALGVSARYANDAHELVELWRREAPEADLGHRAAAWSWLVHVLQVRFGMRVGAGRYLAAWVGDHTAKLPRPAPAALPEREEAPEPETPTLLQSISPTFVAAVDTLTSAEEVAAVWLLHGDPLKPRGAVVSTVAWDYMLAALPALGVPGDKAARDRWLRDRTALARRQRSEALALGNREADESDAPTLAEEGD